ncbi:hypothetical protein MCOR27_005119 [Pyricularia oryzae]|uniref:Glycosyl transferase family 25 domain-containing protein n=1 Tax=Pyricularia grisea TaxID=148305 RepID=A0ABQ8NGK1_PYRGI|nr:hypothetical protein MCOR19_009395 [Pyricularia oryzae]KAI6296755.1 hypothetical protein MCOR33_006746 [Pyricularia grisea]KAI6276393.1 hypothetical protein MCOR26_005607 [Pyricularia oryzae]KAI6279499.1 hypothetical protein MCOR27_005119 [Pyricularia oryzae]KAI6289638.1 hypothetical protein MCOR34_010721 [Pyricularia oryzae]
MIAAIKEKASRVKSQLPISSPIYPPTSSIPSLTTKNSAISDAASNQTLGTDKIAFINLPHRHDRFDAIALQSHLSGIQITRFPAVDVSQLRNNGLPPTENPNRLKDTEKGCWRAHANVWQHMLEHQIPAVVVLESDAGFDFNFRPIMGRLNGAFRELLKKENPKKNFDEDPSDPWLARSDTWDLLSIGHCSDGRNSDGKYVVYDDPDAPHKNWRYDPLNLVLNGQRIVYRANNVVCTTGYLVSLSGAARMLVRTTWNLEHPVDLIIALMAGAGELRAYTQQQVLVAQWEYIEGIKSGGNSDIHDGGNHGRKKSKDEEQRSKEAWEESKKTHNSYQIKSNYRHSDFNDFALGRAWNHIMENKS